MRLARQKHMLEWLHAQEGIETVGGSVVSFKWGKKVTVIPASLWESSLKGFPSANR